MSSKAAPAAAKPAAVKPAAPKPAAAEKPAAKKAKVAAPPAAKAPKVPKTAEQKAASKVAKRTARTERRKKQVAAGQRRGGPLALAAKLAKAKTERNIALDPKRADKYRALLETANAVRQKFRKESRKRGALLRKAIKAGYLSKDDDHKSRPAPKFSLTPKKVAKPLTDAEKAQKEKRKAEIKAKREKKAAVNAQKLEKRLQKRKDKWVKAGGKEKNFPKAQKITIRPKSKVVPEEVRKRIVRNRLLKEKKDRSKLAVAKKNAWRRREYFVRAEKYIKAYRTEAKQIVRAKRAAKAKGHFFVEDQPRLAVVVRIRGILGVSPKPRKVLQLLRLRQINNAVFVRLNKSTLSLLKLVEPYIAWGYPTLATIKKLVYKRGFLKINNKRVPLNNNKQIENLLGKHNIICTEDLIHTIYKTTSKFPLANGILWPFKLNNPRGGFADKGTNFVEGGDAGNREEFINDLLNRMI